MEDGATHNKKLPNRIFLFSSKSIHYIFWLDSSRFYNYFLELAMTSSIPAHPVKYRLCIDQIFADQVVDLGKVPT